MYRETEKRGYYGDSGASIFVPRLYKEGAGQLRVSHVPYLKLSTHKYVS